MAPPQTALPCAICSEWIPWQETGPCQVWLDPRLDQTIVKGVPRGGAFVAHPRCWARFEPFKSVRCPACGWGLGPVNTVNEGILRMACVVCKREYEPAGAAGLTEVAPGPALPMKGVRPPNEPG